MTTTYTAQQLDTMTAGALTWTAEDSGKTRTIVGQPVTADGETVVVVIRSEQAASEYTPARTSYGVFTVDTAVQLSRLSTRAFDSASFVEQVNAGRWVATETEARTIADAYLDLDARNAARVTAGLAS